MTRKTMVFSLLGSLFFLGLLSAPSLADAVNSRDLVRTAPGTGLDGQKVVFEGEAIQQVMFRRGNHGWVNVKDDANAVGIWAPSELLRKIELTGAYGRFGDRVRVAGVFHAACPEHGGDLDIHADQLEILSRGRENRERVSTGYFFGAVCALGLALGLTRIAKRKEYVP